MAKIIFTAGSYEKPLFRVTLEIIHENQSDLIDLQEIIAKYLVTHGGLNWGVSKN
jgi:hypothetical protein